jgi:hypothetical protein
LAKLVGRAVRTVTKWWRKHRDRMTDEPVYADAFVILVAAAVELLAGGARNRAVVRELTSAFVALLREPRTAGYAWEWPTDN